MRKGKKEKRMKESNSQTSVPDVAEIDQVVAPPRAKLVRCKTCGNLYRSDTKQKAQMKKEYVEALLKGLKDPKVDLGWTGQNLVKLGLVREERKYSPEVVEQAARRRKELEEAAIQQLKDGMGDKARDTLRKLDYSAEPRKMRQEKAYRITREGLVLARAWVK